MGRPFKNGVEYFPLDVMLDDKFELIEAEHGILGFGVIIKLLQKVYENSYFVKVDKKAIIVLSKRINVSINLINAVINSAVEWEVFDKKMFEGFGILTSRGIQKRYFEITKRRKKIDVYEEYLLIRLEINVNINRVNVDRSTQSKGKGKGKGKVKGKEIDIKKDLKKYLNEKIKNGLMEFQEKIIEFFDYRMNKPKKDRYESEKGINGLIRDVSGCHKQGLPVKDCIEIAMEKKWLTPNPSYFDKMNLQGVASNIPISEVTRHNIAAANLLMEKGVGDDL